MYEEKDREIVCVCLCVCVLGSKSEWVMRRKEESKICVKIR